MTNNTVYTTPEIELMPLCEPDVLTASDNFVFLPTDEFREI